MTDSHAAVFVSSRNAPPRETFGEEWRYSNLLTNDWSFQWVYKTTGKRNAVRIWAARFFGKRVAWRDKTNMVARETNYSLSQNCWDTFASSRPINVNVNDLDTEGKKTAFALSVTTIFVWDCSTMDLSIIQTTVSRTLFFESVFNKPFYVMSTVKTSDVVS